VRLLTTQNAKTVKGEKKGYLTFILYLAPGNISGREVCPRRTEACFETCLFHSGRGRMKSVQEARIRKTKRLFENRKGFMHDLEVDIHLAIYQAEKRGLIPCIRLDGTSDLGLGGKLSKMFPEVQFYDYTKVVQRVRRTRVEDNNYHLTFSYSGRNKTSCLELLKYGNNVAVVFADELPEKWWGYPVINGDENDLRFLDGSGKIVGLLEKKTGRKTTDEFIQAV
jgi:hypothetical protein